MFKCGVHSFETDDLDAFQLHQEQEVHTIIGVAPCNVCGLSTEFKFTGKVGKKSPALCQSCKENILGGME